VYIGNEEGSSREYTVSALLQNASVPINVVSTGSVIKIYGIQFSVANEAVNFTPTGAGVAWTPLFDGTYKIQVWGAQGGSNHTYYSQGGYAEGKIALTTEDTLYVYVGTNGSMNNGQAAGSGGFNGGGNGSDGRYTDCLGGFGGGGASDVRLVGGTWNNTTSLRSRILVAGGGGGIGGGRASGKGGGLSGTDGNRVTDGTVIPGGGQSAPSSSLTAINLGAFGIGANASGSCNSTNSKEGRGGGGGGYYGGSAGSEVGSSGFNAGGGGGSGYISGMAGCNDSYLSFQKLNSTGSAVVFTDTELKAGNVSFTAPGGGNETGHTGGGYVRISEVQ
jgi:hypothetical protein